MHKYLCALLLATCTTTIMAADDSETPLSLRTLKRTENFSPAALNASPIVVEARQETQVTEKVKQLVTLNSNPSVLEVSATAFANANNDTASLLTSEQIKTLITAETETRRDGDETKMSKMTDVLDLDGKIIYDSARYLGHGLYSQTVLNALIEFGNTVAYRRSYQPQQVGGTEAKPTITVKYDIYEVPPFFTKLLKEFVMTGHAFQTFIDELKLKPLTFGRAQEILSSKDKHLTETFKAVEREFTRKLDAPLPFDIRYHTSTENVAQNEVALAAYFKVNVQESLKSLAIKPVKAKKKKRSKPATQPDQASSPK